MRRVLGSVLLATFGLAGCGEDTPTTPTSPTSGGVTQLQVTELVVGTGAVAVNGATVTVDYTGWLYDEAAAENKGAQFDSSVGGQPLAFVPGAGQVIPGFEQGVAGMRVGGRRRIVIPPSLAYGSQGAGGGAIPPNASLVFDVELLDVSTPSGVTELQVTDLVVGTGAEAVNGVTVTVDYTGWLYDEAAAENKGAQFDSSIGGQPIVFVLGTGQVIAGFDQGLVGMRVGGQRRLVIPPSLAYGSQGAAGGAIPPNATLIFDVELQDVNP